MIPVAVISTSPELSTDFRNSLDGPVRQKPLSRSANLRYRRSASTVRVRSKSTFRRTSLHKQSRWKNVICSPIGSVWTRQIARSAHPPLIIFEFPSARPERSG